MYRTSLHLHPHLLQLHPLPRNLSALKLRSGTQSPSGPGTSSWTTVLSVETTSWICASNAKLIKPALLVKNALLRGVYAIMLSISIVLADGSKPVKSALLITASGSFRNMVTNWKLGSGRTLKL